jgi:hypothetical protein
MTRTHRVGTFTLGSILVAFGTLFLLHLFIPAIAYHVIFKVWPIIFIFLGIEILIANFTQKGEKILYDTTAFALIILLSFFAMGMALVQVCFEYAGANFTLYF